MHPQTFLKTFWRLELERSVFVAMSFDSHYKSRFDHVIVPAITAISIGGQPLKPRRVDISKSGDSILTEISDGIAHSRLVLADVSTIAKDAATGRPFRNANVLYEVGIALACRNPAEVLLIRDDNDDFLFDVSTVPHMTIDFKNHAAAAEVLKEELLGRLREQQFQHDVRVKKTVASIGCDEAKLLLEGKHWDASTIFGAEIKGIANWFGNAIDRLLDKGVITLAGRFSESKHAFQFTPLGLIVKDQVNGNMQHFIDPKALPPLTPIVRQSTVAGDPGIEEIGPPESESTLS
jgi:hypothetical protein